MRSLGTRRLLAGRGWRVVAALGRPGRRRRRHAAHAGRRVHVRRARPAWNIIGGFTGYASFGNVVFFGLGGYTVAVLMVHARLGLLALRCPWRWRSAAGYAVLVGLPVLRLRGHYFAIATLGVAEGTREVVINLPRPHRRRRGDHHSRPRRPGRHHVPGQHRLLLPVPGGLLGVAVAVAFAVVAQPRSATRCAAIHEDEHGAAATVGINTTRAKLAAFAISGCAHRR